MMVTTNIGYVKTAKFDFYSDGAKGNCDSYIPDTVCMCDWKERRERGEYPYCVCEGCRNLYWDIVGAVVDKENKNAKQMDWGCFVWKMTAGEMVAMLSREKYEGSKKLLEIAKKLPQDEDYLPVGIERY
jgi:hypothetical protein